MFYHLVIVGSFVINENIISQFNKTKIMLLMNKNTNLKANNLKHQIIVVADFKNSVDNQRIDAGQVSGFISSLKPA